MTTDKKITVKTIISRKLTGEKITALTAYDYTMASILDDSGIDIILVGDSAGNVIAGYDTTHPVSMDEMIYHTRCVRKGVKRALLVVDMPFLSFQCGIDEAIYNAGLFLKAGAEAVKLEGGEEIFDIVKNLNDFGIPVMGHLGLLPQSVHKLGGYAIQANDEKNGKKLLEDAKYLEKAGAFSIILEKIPEIRAREITEKISIPTIGIGAGRYCDGQILVLYDLLGLTENFNPRYLRKYADFAGEMRKAFKNFIEDVKNGNYPSEKEVYK
ncbi:3-methyl-2-oxobutanoate hydroxymethyltransferase [candidate division KSB1 bacterium]|nr:MAG: 3-methyl-2-oxobutanoate hydroxymethyltransferase [candidate division KSB1 bacterium]